MNTFPRIAYLKDQSAVDLWAEVGTLKRITVKDEAHLQKLRGQIIGNVKLLVKEFAKTKPQEFPEFKAPPTKEEIKAEMSLNMLTHFTVSEIVEVLEKAEDKAKKEMKEYASKHWKEKLSLSYTYDNCVKKMEEWRAEHESEQAAAADAEK